MHESWLDVLGDELETPNMTELRSFLLAEVSAGRRFYPPADRVFNAMELTPFEDVRVVILGQGADRMRRSARRWRSARRRC